MSGFSQVLAPKLLVNGIISSIFAAIVFAISLVQPVNAQEEARVQQASWFGGGWHHSWWGDDDFDAVAYCNERITHMLDEAVEHVDEEESLTDTQNAAWVKLIGTLRTTGTQFAELCDEYHRGDETERASAPERLALMEQVMGMGLAAVQQVRPDFDAFYETLDEDQQAKLDRAFGGRRHHGWH